MSVAPEPCADCDRDPAAGFASITDSSGEKWYCHDTDDDPTCYQLAMSRQRYMPGLEMLLRGVRSDESDS